MSDQVVGVAVLDRAKGALAVLCENAQGIRQFVCIAAVPEGAPTPAGNGPLWRYRETEGVLHIQPSLHVFYEVDGQRQTTFHNGYNWSVPFLPIVPGADLWREVRELNGETNPGAALRRWREAWSGPKADAVEEPPAAEPKPEV